MIVDEENFLIENNIEKIYPDHKNYPKYIRIARKKLKPIYRTGEYKKFQKGIAVIGTRDCSDVGKIFAEQVGRELAKSNFIVNSGLANGIDTFAHKGCIENNGITVAFLAWFHKLYPPENRSLLEKIIETGCVLSENLFMPEKFSKYEFLKRDELIAAFSDAIIVVESKKSGGAKYTSDYGIKKKIPIIICDTKTDNDDLKEGFEAFIKMDSIIANSPSDVIEIIQDLNNKKKSQLKTLDNFS